MAQLNQCVVLTITEEKLQEICDKIGNNKPSGLEAIPKKAFKLPAKIRFDPFINVFGWLKWLEERLRFKCHWWERDLLPLLECVL